MALSHKYFVYCIVSVDSKLYDTGAESNMCINGAISVVDKIRGGLYGVFIGDALSMPVSIFVDTQKAFANTRSYLF